MESKSIDRYPGIFMSLLAAACFALVPLFTLPLLKEGIAVPAIMAYRFLIGAFALWALLFVRRERMIVSGADFLKLFVLGLLSYLMVICYAEALKYMASGSVTTIQFLYPIMVMLIMIVFFHEKFRWYAGLAVLLAFSGVASISFGSGEETQGPGSLLPGISLSLATGLWSALYYVAIKMMRMAHVDSLLMTFYIALFGAAFAFAQALLGGTLQMFGGLSNWGLVLLLAIVTIVIANLALIRGIELVGPTMSSILGVTEPLTAVVIGVTVFGESLTLQIIAGIVLIILSVLAVVIGPHLSGKQKSGL